MSNNFYRLDALDEHDPDYAIILGERANGKSYAVKERALTHAIDKMKVSFVLIRRYDADIKSNLMNTYFNDTGLKKLISDKTNEEYNCVTFWQGYFYLANDEGSNKVTKGPAIGYAMALNDDERYKSSFVQPDVEDIIFEEFTTNKLYLSNEVSRFMNLCSTILRLHKGTVYMIANTISRVCPYFNEWSLRNIPAMKFGQIDEYNFEDSQGNKVKVCVELCASPEHKKSGMFFGRIGKTIEGGQWETKERPHLVGDLADYDILYSLSLVHMNFRFNIYLLCNKEEGFTCVYCYPASVKIFDRVLTQEYSTDIQKTPTLHKNNRAECLISELVKNNKLVFPTNLIAEDFYTVIQNMSCNPFMLM